MQTLFIILSVLAGNFAGAQTGFDAQTREDYRELANGFAGNATLMETLQSKTAAATAALENITISENRSTVKWDMCQTYYQGEDMAKCADIASRIVSNVSLPSPVITLGDSSKPPMVFIHGWPQTPAVWVNQFEHFCDGEDASYYCVGLSFMNFEPDTPWISDKTLLTYKGQRDRWYETMTQLGLSNITLILDEWAATIGYQGAYEWADILHALISMEMEPPLMSSLPANFSDVFNGEESVSTSDAVATLLPYQQVNILTSNGTGSPGNYSYLQDMFRTMQYSNFRAFSPLASMQPGTGWMYQGQASQDGQGDGFATFAEQHENKVEQGWKFLLMPDLPRDVPMLYLHGDCAPGTGCPLCTKSQKCVKIGGENQEWLQAVENHTPDSKTAPIQSGDLPMLDQVSDFNMKIEHFLEGIARSDSDSDSIESKSNNQKDVNIVANVVVDASEDTAVTAASAEESSSSMVAASSLATLVVATITTMMM